MKFTNGYWHIRKEISPLYAVEYMDNRIKGDEVTIYAPTKRIDDRAVCVDLPMITVKLSSPMENVIKVSVAHVRRSKYDGPFVEINTADIDVKIIDEENQLIYQTGTLKAVVNKEPGNWSITFYDGEKYLSQTGYRSMARMLNNDTKKSYMVEQLELDIDEYVYGFGEKFTPFVKNGHVVEIWNEDGGTASEISYKNVPFYITNKGYGVLVDNQGDVQFEVASEKVERVQFSVEGERLDYYFIAGGTPLGTVQRYTQLTGKPALPPAWTFGLWLTTSFTTDYDEETVTSFIDGMADRDIPLSVFHFDCYWMTACEWCNFEWDPATFPDPVGMLKRYKEKGLHICVWINPYIGEKSPLFEEGCELGVLLKNKDGSVFQTDFWQPGAGYVDFTNPKAVEWYQSKLKALMDMGVDCFKTDFGERIPVNGIEYFDGSDQVKMHNHYTYLYNKCVFELLERGRGIGEAAVFARSATVGGQQFPVHWGGDCNATYKGMAETLRGGLSLACGGFGFWSHDIGGFENMATADLYKRWCAFGLMCSHSRLHGSTSYRVPWLFDEEACEVLEKFVKLKCSMMPYLYAQAVKAHEEGTPMLQPMFLAFPEERACECLDRQYMLGSSLMVAPVLKDSGEVEYYLPNGKWIHLFTGEIADGGMWKKETYDYFSLPVWIKQDAAIVVGSCNERPDYDYGKDIQIKLSYLTEGKENVQELYNQEGDLIGKIYYKKQDGNIQVNVEGENISWSYISLEE